MARATATFNGKVIAETNTYEFVEGNVYFPPEAVDKSVLTPVDSTTFCPWKGTASYYNINVNGEKAANAAWYYPEPLTEAASKLKDHVAFYKSKVEVIKIA